MIKEGVQRERVYKRKETSSIYFDVRNKREEKGTKIKEIEICDTNDKLDVRKMLL